MDCVLRYIMTMMANPTLTSAAATTIIKKTNNWPSLPTFVPLRLLPGGAFLKKKPATGLQHSASAQYT